MTAQAFVEREAMQCPYGWKCPVFRVDNLIGFFHGDHPVFLDDKKCYICRGLMRREFQLFVTVRLPSYVTDTDLGIELLKKFMQELLTHCDKVKIVAVLAVGKVIKVNGRYLAKYERPHLHILVCSKDRIGWIRLRKDDQLEILRKFISDIHTSYSLVLGPEYPGSIDIRWIRYPQKSKKRRERRRRRGADDDRRRTVFRLRIYMFKQLTIRNGIYVNGMHISRHRRVPRSDDRANTLILVILYVLMLVMVLQGD